LDELERGEADLNVRRYVPLPPIPNCTDQFEERRRTNLDFRNLLHLLRRSNRQQDCRRRFQLRPVDVSERYGVAEDLPRDQLVEDDRSSGGGRFSRRRNS